MKFRVPIIKRECRTTGPKDGRPASDEIVIVEASDELEACRAVKAAIQARGLRVDGKHVKVQRKHIQPIPDGKHN